MAQEPGEGTPISRSRSLVEDIPSRGPIDRFMAANESGWTSATYNFYRSVLSNFVTAFPVMPTRLDEVIQYVENHRKRKSRYLWNIGTVRSSYKALRTFYSWTKANYLVRNCSWSYHRRATAGSRTSAGRSTGGKRPGFTKA